MFLLWLVLIGGALYLIFSKSGKRTGNPAKTGEDPVELLKKRYINGEITDEDYKKMLKIVNE